jgi:hypothetical protein
VGARCQVHAPARKYLSVQGRSGGMAEKSRTPGIGRSRSALSSATSTRPGVRRPPGAGRAASFTARRTGRRSPRLPRRRRRHQCRGRRPGRCGRRHGPPAGHDPRSPLRPRRPGQLGEPLLFAAAVAAGVLAAVALTIGLQSLRRTAPAVGNAHSDTAPHATAAPASTPTRTRPACRHSRALR